jgi:hypothetical protein
VALLCLFAQLRTTFAQHHLTYAYLTTTTAATAAACVAADLQCSPRIDLIKRTVGLEYEYVLGER